MRWSDASIGYLFAADIAWTLWRLYGVTNAILLGRGFPVEPQRPSVNYKNNMECFSCTHVTCDVGGIYGGVMTPTEAAAGVLRPSYFNFFVSFSKL